MPKSYSQKVVGAFSLDDDIIDYVNDQEKKGFNKSRLVNDALRKSFKLGKYDAKKANGQKAN